MTETLHTPDIQTWIAAARRFVRLRRRLWQSWFGGIVVWLVLILPVIAAKDHLNPAAASGLGMIGAVTFIACWVGAALNWLGLLNFRCPRCGERFMVSWFSSWPTSRCKHCGFDLGPASMAL